MHTSGRSIASRLGLALVFCAAAQGDVALETWTADVPVGSAYVVTAMLTPGLGGAEVCGGTQGHDHVDFRIGFAADSSLSVNGAHAGTFDPSATYRVIVSAQRLGCAWFATTNVVNQNTGETVFQQFNYPMPSSAEEVRVVAEHVIQLTVQ
jgi:hypothetical protein